MDALAYPLPRETRESAILDGDGGASYGPFAFKIFDEEDVDVWRLDTGETVWALQAVTVTKTAAAAYDTFSILFPANVLDTTTFIVAARRLHEREVAATRGGAISAQELEKELSKQGSVLQEIRRDLNRTVRFPPGVDGVPFLPSPDPNMLIGWDPVLNALVNTVTRGDEATIRQAADDALRSLIGQAGPIETAIYDSVAAVQLANVKPGINKLAVGGFASASSAGSWSYRRSVAEPAHDGKFQSGDGAWWELAETTVHPIMFGAAMDGSTDDTAAVNKAVAFVKAIGGGRIDLLGKTVRVDATISISGSNIVFENGTIDFSNAVSGDKLFEAKGSLGASAAFTAASFGASSIVASSADGIVQDEYIYLYSTNPFGVGSIGTGEMQRVYGISGTTISLWKRLRDTYTTTPIFYKPAFLRNVTFRNLVIKGLDDPDATQYGFDFECIIGLTVEGVKTTNFGDRHYQITNCIDFKISKCDLVGIAREAVTGLAYGIAINEASQNGQITACTFKELKHGITGGGSGGVSRDVIISNCHASEIYDAAYDAHPNTEFYTIDACHCDNWNAKNGSVNGVVVQGANMTVTNCRISGFSVGGILAQPACLSAAIASDHYNLSGNVLTDGYGTTSYAIFLQNLRINGELSFSIDNNTINGSKSTLSHGVWIDVPATKGLVRGAGSSINNNRALVKGHAVYMVTGASGASTSIQNFSIGGNVFRSASATLPVIQIASGQSAYIVTGNIQGNVLYGGNYGLSNSGSLAAHLATGGNSIRAWATGATTGTFVSAGTNYTS